MLLIEKVKNKLFKYLNKHSEVHEDLETPSGIQAEFKLTYKSLTIGYLTLNDGVWKFSYSEEFKQQDELRPIVQFPDTTKEFENEELWPFFTIRVPVLYKPEIEDIIESENIDRSNEVELLQSFVKKTISNPYELVGAA